jgi:ribosomal protein S18 acetylase RimI-like enzyme
VDEGRPLVREARAEDGEAVARVFYESASDWWDRYTGGRGAAVRVLRAQFGRRFTGVSTEVCTVAELDGRVAAAVAAYPAREGARRAGRSLRVALRRLSPLRWPRTVRIYDTSARRTASPPADAMYVDVLATEAGMRRRGAARALMEDVERRARARGLSSIALETDTGNEAALALYGSLGFEVVGSHPASPPRPELVSLLKRLGP